jgi:hypothetical protein
MKSNRPHRQPLDRLLCAFCLASLVAAFTVAPRFRLEQTLQVLSGKQTPPNLSPDDGGGHPNTRVVRYASTFLDITSMWGMGADARTIPPRRHYVPLVLWTDEAVVRVRQAWRRLQWQTSCARAMYIYPHDWGITSQMRDYGDAAIVALAFSRPLRLVLEGARKPRWCVDDDAWLECFFMPLCGSDCKRVRQDLEESAPGRFSPNTHTGAARPGTTIEALRGKDVLHMDEGAQFTFVLDDARFFPANLWMQLVTDGLVMMFDRHDARIDALELRRKDPQLFHTISLSALRTMLTSVIFALRPEIADEVDLKLRRLAYHPNLCAALHMRWTDKQADGGITKNLFANDTRHLVPALQRARCAHQFSDPECILLMTDDDLGVVPHVRSALQHVHIEVVSRVSEHFGGDLSDEYNLYTKIGHNYFKRRANNQQDRFGAGRAFDYYKTVIVDANVAAHAQFMIGMGSSGVSQYVAQLIGFKHRADSNALAMWQEDLNDVVV